jgi:hypothetical protein
MLDFRHFDPAFGLSGPYRSIFVILLTLADCQDLIA